MSESERQPGAEIDVTEEMLEGGLAQLWTHLSTWDHACSEDRWRALATIYREMASRSPQFTALSGEPSSCQQYPLKNPR